MSKCAVCEQDRQAGKEKKIYTAKILKEERGPERMVHGGGREVDVTTTYGEFQEHPFFLCANCHTLWDKIVLWGGVGLSILVSVIMGVVAVRQQVDWLFVLALFVFIAGIGVAALLSTDARLERKAKQQRGEERIKTFNEHNYNKLLQENEQRNRRR